MTITHPVPQEHPLSLEDAPPCVITTWSEDSKDSAAGDQLATVDRVVLANLLPFQNYRPPIICPSCNTPVSPTGECRCSD